MRPVVSKVLGFIFEPFPSASLPKCDAGRNDVVCARPAPWAFQIRCRGCDQRKITWVCWRCRYRLRIGNMICSSCNDVVAIVRSL